MNEKIDTIQEFDCFISMPFDKNFEFVYEESISKIDRFLENKYKLNLIRLDKKSYKERRIEDNVLRNIDSANLLIADISKHPKSLQPNVSVIHEIGYATAKGIPFILIGTEGSHKDLPANLMGSIISEYDIDKDKNLQLFSQKLGNQIIELIEDKNLFTSLKPEHHVKCFEERPLPGLIDLIAKAKHRVYILTTNLNYTNTYLKDAIIQALEISSDNPKFKAEFLTMDPESDVANARAIQLGRPIRQYRDELRKSLDEMTNDLKKYQPRMEIITYRTLPTQMVFIIDDNVFLGVVSFGQQSREGFHFFLDKKAIIEPFLSHFRALKALAVATVHQQ